MCFLHNDLMVRNTPTAKVAKVMHVMMMIGVEIVVSSVLCAILEGAVARGGAKDVDMGFNVEGGFVIFLLMFPFIHGLPEFLSQFLAPLL